MNYIIVDRSLTPIFFQSLLNKKHIKSITQIFFLQEISSPLLPIPQPRFPDSLGVIGHRRGKLGRGGKAGTRAQLVAILVENDWDGHEHKGHTTQERTRPVNLERIEHVRGEEREDTTGQGSEEGISGNGGGGAAE